MTAIKAPASSSRFDGTPIATIAIGPRIWEYSAIPHLGQAGIGRENGSPSVRRSGLNRGAAAQSGVRPAQGCYPPSREISDRHMS